MEIYKYRVVKNDFSFMLWERFKQKNFNTLFVYKLVFLLIGCIQQVLKINSTIAELTYIKKPQKYFFILDAKTWGVAKGVAYTHIRLEVVASIVGSSLQAQRVDIQTFGETSTLH